MHDNLLLRTLHLIDSKDLNVLELHAKQILFRVLVVLNQPLYKLLLDIAICGDLRSVCGYNSNLCALKTALLNNTEADLESN